jgi:PAS domain S-box-containing protein
MMFKQFRIPYTPQESLETDMAHATHRSSKTGNELPAKTSAAFARLATAPSNGASTHSSYKTNTSAAAVAELQATIAAIGKSQATIEFAMDGTILTANDNFLHALGYRLDEIQGRHHRIFVDPAEQGGSEYSDFWLRLNRGEYRAAEYKRIGKGGREVWIQASYNPILGLDGTPFKVIKFATDTNRESKLPTGSRLKSRRYQGSPP